MTDFKEVLVWVPFFVMVWMLIALLFVYIVVRSYLEYLRRKHQDKEDG